MVDYMDITSDDTYGVKFSEQAADKTALSICLVLPASNAMRTRHLFCDQVF